MHFEKTSHFKEIFRIRFRFFVVQMNPYRRCSSRVIRSIQGSIIQTRAEPQVSCRGQTSALPLPPEIIGSRDLKSVVRHWT